MISIKRWFACLFPCLLYAVPLSAQESLKSLEEEYYDFLALRGVIERPYLNYRTLSDSAWEPDEDTGHPWADQNLKTWHNNLRVYGPALFVSYNTASPYGQNDGALWQGKGINVSLDGGFRFEKYGLELTFKPRISFSQNQSFDLMPRSEHFQTSEYEGKARDYGYFWREIDLPQRFGDDPFFNYDWGDTEIRYTWKTLTAGFGTQSIWLGPAYFNAILHSNNAPAYPKIDIGLRKQPVTIPWLDWYLGDIEFRLWVGRLSESDYYDNDASNNYSMFHGFAFAYAPSFLPGLTLFVNRTCRVPWEPENIRYIIPSGQSKNTGGDDQKMSFGASWLLPQAGAEIYGEIGLDDFVPGKLKGYLRYPFHTMVYTWGLKKAVKIAPAYNVHGELIFEWNTMEVSQDYQFQWPSSFYFHGGLRQGYTNRGQLLGSGSGWGGNSQYFAFKLYYPKGVSSLFIHRNNPDNDFVYSQAIRTGTGYDAALDDKYFTGFKSNFIVGVTTDYFLTSRLCLGGGFAYNLIINPFYFYSDPDKSMKFWQDRYLHNFSLNLMVQYRY